MTPPTDSARRKQRMTVIVLGDLLEQDLPVIDWNVKAPKRHDTDPDLVGWLKPRPRSEYGDEQAARDLARWARYLHCEIEPITNYWFIEGSVDGLTIWMYAQLSDEYRASHEPPRLVDLLNRDNAGQFIRRSAPVVGELAEVVK